MSRWMVVAVIVFAAQWAVPARAAPSFQLYGNTPMLNPSAPVTQHVALFDTVGMLGLPVVTFGFMQLGHLIDVKRSPTSEITNSGFDKVGFLIGLGAMIPGYWGLGQLTNVPVSWASSAAGVGLGLATGVVLLGVQIGLMAAFHLPTDGKAAGVMSIVTLIGWSVATTLFVKADPFHLTRTDAPTMGQASAPLLSMSF